MSKTLEEKMIEAIIELHDPKGLLRKVEQDPRMNFVYDPPELHKSLLIKKKYNQTIIQLLKSSTAAERLTSPYEWIREWKPE